MVLLTRTFGKAAGDPFGVESDLFAGDILEALVGRVIPVSLPFAQAAQPAADSTAKAKPVQTFNTAAIGAAVGLAKMGPAAKLTPNVVNAGVKVTPQNMEQSGRNSIAKAGEAQKASAQILDAAKQQTLNQKTPEDEQGARADGATTALGRVAAGAAIGAGPGALLAAGAEALHPGAGAAVKTVSAGLTAGAAVIAIMNPGQGPSAYNTERVSRRDARAQSSFASTAAPSPVNVATNAPAPAAPLLSQSQKDNVVADANQARGSLESLRVYTKLALTAAPAIARLSLDGEVTKTLADKRKEMGVTANEGNLANALEKNENAVSGGPVAPTALKLNGALV